MRRLRVVAERLAREGSAVHAFDLRGHALSQGELVWVDEFGYYVKDLGTFVDLVREKEPGKPLFLFGHSMGGAISTLYALERKQGDLDGLILSAAALKPGENASGFQLVEKAASKDKTLKLYEGLVHDLLHEPEKDQVVSDIVAWLDARGGQDPRSRVARSR